MTPGTINLNAGTLSPTPIPVMDALTELRLRQASNPSDFVWRQTPPLIDASRQRLAQYLRCKADDLLLLENITFALNIIVDSLKLDPGGEILTTDHEYGAMLACWRRAAKRQDCTIKQVALPYLSEEPGWILEAFSRAITPGKTKVLFFSHVNCTTGLVMPAKELAEMARKRGLICIVDGAHGPGMVPIDLDSIDADFYAANCHKWMMAPCNVGFMHVAPRAKKMIEPQITSWGYEYKPEQAGEDSGFGGNRWQWSYEFHGSVDRTPQMVLPQTLDFRAELGGDDAVISRCRTLVEHARSAIGSLGLKPATPQNPQMSGAIVAFDFPPPTDRDKARGLFWDRHRIECPVTMGGGKHFLRVSCGWFNTAAEIDALASAVSAHLSDGR